MAAAAGEIVVSFLLLAAQDRPSSCLSETEVEETVVATELRVATEHSADMCLRIDEEGCAGLVDA